MTAFAPKSQAACVAAAILVAIVCVGVEARQAVEPFEHWAAIHALPLRTLEPGPDTADLRQLAPAIGTARVVALGEPAHGAHEPLAFRNRLFQYLVEAQGFTAIAIESGLPESRRVQDYVEGGHGDVRQVVLDNLSYNFGALGENVELVQWMRAYNADTAHRRRLRFYGIDLSIAGPRGYTPKALPFETALAYVARVDQASAERQQRAFAPFIARLPGVASFSTAEHKRLSAAIGDLVSLFERHRRTFIAKTSEAEYAWAQRNAILARQAEHEFSVALDAPPGGPILPGDWRAAEARDQAMADNVQWALGQEGPVGRVLVFAHNAHVKNTQTEGGIWSAFARAPNSMGVYLRAALGDDLVIIGTSSAASPPGFPPFGPDAGNLDAALGRVGLPQFLLDLRPSHDDRTVKAWLAEQRTMRANFNTSLLLSPGKSFDALLFIQTLTRAHVASPPR